MLPLGVPLRPIKRKEKMKLGIYERINLQSLLPNQGDFVTLKKSKELVERLVFTDEELKEYEIKSVQIDQNRMMWVFNEKGKDYKADIQIGEFCEEVIIKILKEKDSTKTLESFQISLYDKFVNKNFEGSGKEEKKEAEEESAVV